MVGNTVSRLIGPRFQSQTSFLKEEREECAGLIDRLKHEINTSMFFQNTPIRLCKSFQRANVFVLELILYLRIIFKF